MTPMAVFDKVDGKVDVCFARWEDFYPLILMIIINSFVFTLFPKYVSAVKVDWLDIILEVLSVDRSQFLVCDGIIMGVLLRFSSGPNLLNSPTAAVVPHIAPNPVTLMLSFLPERVSAMEVDWLDVSLEIDGKIDVSLTGWEDSDPLVLVVVIHSFVLTLLPKPISAVKIDWFDFAFEIVDWPQLLL